MPIGNCDNCDRKNVPVAHYETIHGDTTQCFICTADPWVKDPDPDPYGELADALQTAREIEAEMRQGRKD